MATLNDCSGGINRVMLLENYSHIHTDNIDTDSIKASIEIGIESIQESNSETTRQDYDRENKLNAISVVVSKLQNEYLKETGGKTTIVDKCRNFSLEAWGIVGEMRALATKNSPTIEGKRDELLDWPAPGASDPTLFYDGKLDKVVFNRNKDWFKTMGFTKYETPYTFTDRWDKKEIKATFLVPNNLGPNDPAPSITWFMHGGGFCTGASDHIPWFSYTSMRHAFRNKSILICPDYPLGPEGSLLDITFSLRDFLLFYSNDLFLRTHSQPYSNWTSWLSTEANIPRINPRQSPILLEGESAGGHAAVMTAFINAEKDVGVGLPIKVALLRFPMLAHYTRTFGPDMTYIGHPVDKKDTETQVRLLEEEIAKLEGYGLVPTRVKGYAPDKMAGAFLLSTTGRWKSVFQRSHGPYTHKVCGDPFDWPVNGDGEGTWDCIERAEGSVGKVDHGKLPPMMIYHGARDTNCPIGDTERFVGVLKSRYPRRYNGDTVYLETVGYLSGKEKPVGSQDPVTEVNHAFDYQILEEHEPWLKDIYAKVDAHWKA